MVIVCKWFLYFILYSFIGWTCETIYCSIGRGKFENRGFLNGPICPVYAVGGLTVIVILEPFSSNPFLLFIFGMIVTGVIEYITGFLLEKIFHLKLWDYSGKFMNLNGRVCLKNLVLFAILSLLAVYIIHPFMVRQIDQFSDTVILSVACVLFGIMLADMISTVYSTLKLSGKLKEAQKIMDEITEKTSAYVKEQSLKLDDYKQQLDEKRDAAKEYIDSLKEKYEKSVEPEKFLHRRFLRAFPNMSSTKYSDSLVKIKEKIALRKKQDEIERNK